MTNEEAIKQLKKCKSFHNGSYGTAINLAIKALEQTRWISVDERLPEENISVIGTTKFNDIYETELYNDCGENKWYADGNYDVPIVAWMPLPEPYEAESEDKE